ncbi:hypothetical protein GCM10027404_14620 [Arthrobacter tumbae]
MHDAGNRPGQRPPLNGGNGRRAQEEKKTRAVPSKVLLRLHIVTELPDGARDKMGQAHPETTDGPQRQWQLLFRCRQRLGLACASRS